MNKKSIAEIRPFSLKRLFARWEWILLFLIIVVFIVNVNIAPYFLNPRIMFDMTFNFMEKGLIALILAFIIIIGQIDISIASNMAMSAVVMSICFQAGINIWASVAIGLLTGTLGGFFNGFVITRVKIHSIIVTLATYSLFRGIAYVLLGDQAVTGFPERFAHIGRGYIGNSMIPLQLMVFMVMAVIFWLVLHKTKYGRYLYAIGNNETGARFSGIPVDRIKVILYTVCGFICAMAGMLFVSRVGVARPNLAEAFLFEIVTIVLLGGVSIYGGEGSILGVFLSLFLIGLTRFGMTLMNIKAPIITVVIGFLLIIAILAPKVFRFFAKE